MNQTPFVTLFTPLTALPIILGLFLGIWGCVKIIAAAYGLDLVNVAPWVHSEEAIGAPLILFGVAVFAILRGQMMRSSRTTGDSETIQVFDPLSWLERACLVSVGFGFLALPYWLALPVPEGWLIGGGLLAWFGWRKMQA